MDVATFPLTRQNLTHSSVPNLLVYVVVSHDGLQVIRSVVPAAAHLTDDSPRVGFVRMRGVDSAIRESSIREINALLHSRKFPATR